MNIHQQNIKRTRKDEFDWLFSDQTKMGYSHTRLVGLANTQRIPG